MAGSENLQRLQAAYRAWDKTKGGSSEAWLEILSDEVCVGTVVSDEPGLEFAKDCRTKHGMVDYFKALLTDWEMIHWTPTTFVSEGDTVAMFGKCAWTNKATSKVADVDIAHLWTFKDGLVVEFREVFDTASAARAATPT